MFSKNKSTRADACARTYVLWCTLPQSWMTVFMCKGGCSARLSCSPEVPFRSGAAHLEGKTIACIFGVNLRACVSLLGQKHALSSDTGWKNERKKNTEHLPVVSGFWRVSPLLAHTYAPCKRTSYGQSTRPSCCAWIKWLFILVRW